MSLRIFKPVTPGRRGLVLIDRSDLWKGRPLRSLVKGRGQKSGRNAHGHLTMRFRGGGHKRLYRNVDFVRPDEEGKSLVQRVEYDPNRSAFIALIKSESGRFSYILAPKGIGPGSVLGTGENADILPGHVLALKDIPSGVFVHNVETKVGGGGKIARAAGTSVQVMGLDGDYVLLKLVSGEVKRVFGRCRATIGVLGNADHKNQNLGKAGRSRWKGRKPHVRGVAMNPVDHPHGGRTCGGRHPVSPWGVLAKGGRLKKNDFRNRFVVRSRHRVKRR